MMHARTEWMTTLNRRVRGTRDPAGQEVILTPNQGLQTERQALADPELLVLSLEPQQWESSTSPTAGKKLCQKNPSVGKLMHRLQGQKPPASPVEKPGTSQECLDTDGVLSLNQAQILSLHSAAKFRASAYEGSRLTQ